MWILQPQYPNAKWAKVWVFHYTATLTWLEVIKPLASRQSARIKMAGGNYKIVVWNPVSSCSHYFISIDISCSWNNDSRIWKVLRVVNNTSACKWWFNHWSQICPGDLKILLPVVITWLRVRIKHLRTKYVYTHTHIYLKGKQKQNKWNWNFRSHTRSNFKNQDLIINYSPIAYMHMYS